MIELTRLRRTARATRRALSLQEQRQHSLQLKRKIRTFSWYWRARNLAVYLARDGELDLNPLIKLLLRQGKKVYLPVIRSYPPRKLWFSRYFLHTKLKSNRFAIPEPIINQRDKRVPIFLDVVLAPMVAFDDTGQRLGMGGGYYDRTFSNQINKLLWKRPRLIGIAHECQLVTHIPVRTWDVPMNMIVTESNVYKSKFMS
jgi:5-formyltetrahydrofolate cyclo-ligase